MRLLDYISPVLQRPLSKLGGEACNVYEALPGEFSHRPGTPEEALSRVLSYGLPCAVIGKNPSFEKMMEGSIPSILQSGRMERHIWGVMYAGALLTQLGSRVEFLKEHNDRRTPDIRAHWDEGFPVDCEVTTVDVKEQQERLDAILSTLTTVIGVSGRDWHLLIHLGQIPTTEAQTEIIDAVVNLRSGEVANVPNVWQVHAVPIGHGEALAGGAGLEALRPAWWDYDGPTLNSSGLAFGGGTNNTRRLRLCAKLSFISYLNSIERKVRTQQRDRSNPYVVIVNQGAGGAMPMRHARLVDELAGRLPLWDHVSAILLFDYRPYPSGLFCWKLSLHINSKAKLKAPDALMNLTPRDKEVCVNVYE
jgi:hypothetical protein